MILWLGIESAGLNLSPQHPVGITPCFRASSVEEEMSEVSLIFPLLVICFFFSEFLNDIFSPFILKIENFITEYINVDILID